MAQILISIREVEYNLWSPERKPEISACLKTILAGEPISVLFPQYLLFTGVNTE